MNYVLDEPREAPRGIAQIAATISNTLLGVALVATGLVGLIAIAAAALDIADQTWISLGARITAELGVDVATLFETFQIDIAVILATVAEQNNLPEFGALVRQVLALLMVGAAALVLAGAAPLWVARAIWSRRPERAVLLYVVLLIALGAAGLAVAGVPQLIWGLALANGLLTLVASRTIRPSA